MSQPVVCNGSEVGNWHYTTELSFDKVIKELSQTAFNPQILQNTKDPLFLSLNFKTWGNKATINKAAAILQKYFSDQQRLLSMANTEYTYQGGVLVLMVRILQKNLLKIYLVKL